MSEVELLPCPCCRMPARFSAEYEDCDGNPAIECSSCNLLSWTADDWNNRAAIELDRASRAVFDVEAMLVDTVPGGSICDPQAIADNIREYFEKHTPVTPPAIDLSKEGNDDSDRS